MYQLYRDRPLLVLAIVLANILLSAWCLYNDPVVNNDGVTYIAIARYIAEGNWQAAFDTYSWPYYSVFIVITSKLFFVDVESAAYLLNTIFVTSLTLAFVCIVGELSENNRRVLLIATIVILLFPSINKYRSFIIRDFGYLSCYLWSLYFILRFCKSFDKKHLVGWLVAAALSCLFRFEGIAFLLIAPYFLILFSATNLPHRRTVLLSMSAAIIALTLGLLFWYLNDKYSATLEMAAKTGQDINGLTDLFYANLENRLGEQELTTWNYLLVTLGNIWVMIYELVRRMAVFYLVFAAYAYFKKLALQEELQLKVWLVYLVTNIAVLTGFSIFNNFLVSRYTLATALTLLVLAPMAIDHFINYAAKGGVGRKFSAALIAVILLGISTDRLIESTEKMHLKNAGRWLARNIGDGAKVYSNNKLIVFYANRSVDETLNHLYSTDMMIEFFDTNQLRRYDYLAFEGNSKDRNLETLRRTLNYQLGTPIHMVQRGEEKYVFIYDIHIRSRNAKRQDLNYP